MPSERQRLHGFTIVSRGLRLGRQFLLPAILGGASVGDGVAAVFQWTLVIVAVPSFAIAVAQWLAFRYSLEGDELIIDSGVISRRRRVIPVARIQNVNLERSALERLAGVAELKLETASGGAETEASLAVLHLEAAHALQRELRARRARPAAEPTGGRAGPPITDPLGPGPTDHGPTPADGGGAVEAPEDELLLQLSMVDLAVAGATSNEAGLIAAGLATVLEFVNDLMGPNQLDAWLGTLSQRGISMGVTGTLLLGVGLVVGFVVLGWLVSIVATVVRFHGFTLTRSGTDLRREYGLFSRHQTTIPLHRVQAVRIEETILRRPLGLASLKIETAGASHQQRQQGQGGGAEAYVPITRRRDVGRLIRAVFEDARFEGVELNPVAPVSRRRSFFRLSLPIAIGTAVAVAFDPLGWAVLALLAPAWFLARAQYRARAWARPEPYTIVRNGVLTRVNAVIPERKIQTLHLRESPFQRRWCIATLMIDTAGGSRAARAVDLHRSTGDHLLLALARDSERARRRPDES